MKALLDTHTFLWWNTDDPMLSRRAREIIANGQNEIYLSTASVWEIVIKTAKGRLILPEAPEQYISQRMRLYRFQPLPIHIHHAVQVCKLPLHHNDPFDRMLVAQSQVETIPLITRDENIRLYDLEILW